MKPLPSSALDKPGQPTGGFSLVEVTLALGIMAFCLIPLLGLLPTGLNAQRTAQESARAAVAMNLLSTAVRSAQFVSRDSSGAATYRFPQFFSDNATPVTNPTTVTAGGTVTTRVYAILDDGSIRKTGDTTPARQSMFVQITPPATDAQLLTASAGSSSAPAAAIRVFAYITWPALPTDTPDAALSTLTNRQGAVESYVTYVPTN